MNIIGYLDRLSAAPGDTVTGRFSTPATAFTAGLVRLFNGDPHPLGPGVDIRPVATSLDGMDFPGRVQPLHKGSFIRTAPTPLPAATAVVLEFALQPTLPRAGHPQAVVTLGRGEVDELAVVVDEAGTAHLVSPTGTTSLGPVERDAWYRAAVDLAPADGRATARLTDRWGVVRTADATTSLSAGDPVAVTFAADAAAVPSRHFNGRIDTPVLRADGTEVAAWDFGPSTTLRVVDNRHGDAWAAFSVNFPLRACLGIDGAPDDPDPRLTPAAYRAVHFHDDDLDDANWDDDVVLALPADLPSGVYGLHVEADDGTSDTVPFVVVPAPGARRDVLVVLPTLAYLAYSCEHVMADAGARAYLEGVGVDDPPEFGGNKHDTYLLAEGLRSLYDVHTDGSGYCTTSIRKPLPNVRPDHRWAAVAGGATSAHQFSADLHLVKWLEQRGISHDVITDEEVHRDGADAFAGYRVVLTGSHPEYPTSRMLHAYQDHVARGGRLMYLGGNGFYWVTSIDPERGHTVEIRRTAGIRAWQPRPGEWHHATTGELGGLWRLRGRTPQSWLGVGMASQGFDTNRPYTLGAAVDDPRVGFVWEGVDTSSGLLGDFESMVNGHGAAGVEIDRADIALGTPPESVVLASATGFSRAYGLDPVEVALPDGCYDGATSDKVRCDLVLVPATEGGAVFSTGSIAWCGSLLVNGGDNPVSRLTENVLRGFRDLDLLPFAND